MFTRSSVHWADRIVAASSSYGLRWSSAHRSRAVPGYSSAEALEGAASAPGRRCAGGARRGHGRRRASGGEGTHRYRGCDAPPRDRPTDGPGPPRAGAAPGGRSTSTARRTSTAAVDVLARRHRRGARRRRRPAAPLGAGRRPGRRRPRARRSGSPSSASCCQLRRPLPVDEPWRPRRAAVRRRTGRGGLAGGQQPRLRRGTPSRADWTLDDLRARIAEPWFDPAGFLLHEADGRLAGFCWTKVHRDADPPLGEIYVIAVDPSPAGSGLGRALTLAGLDHLHRAGLDVGMLYVDGTNEAGLRLYDRLGFTRAPHRPQLHASRCRPHERRLRTRYDVTRDDLAALLAGQPRYRVDQVWAGLYEQLAAPDRAHRAAQGAAAPSSTTALPLALDAGRRVSTSDGGETVKWLWGSRDGTQVETVLMHYDDRSTVCVSSQAGCAMGCGFCATGQAGFDRHLTAGEIVEQVVRAGTPRPRRRPAAVQRRVHGDGRAARQLRPHLGRRRADPRRPRAVGPPPHRLDRRASCPASAGSPPRRCR